MGCTRTCRRTCRSRLRWIDPSPARGRSSYARGRDRPLRLSGSLGRPDRSLVCGNPSSTTGGGSVNWRDPSRASGGGSVVQHGRSANRGDGSAVGRLGSVDWRGSSVFWLHAPADRHAGPKSWTAGTLPRHGGAGLKTRATGREARWAGWVPPRRCLDAIRKTRPAPRRVPAASLGKSQACRRVPTTPRRRAARRNRTGLPANAD